MKQDDEKDTKSVSIKATYPFGTVDIENIEVKPLNLIESSTEPKSKTSAPTKVIKTTTISEVAVIGNKFRFSFCQNIPNNRLIFLFRNCSGQY